MKRKLVTLASVLLFVLISSEIFAQTAPNISYSPSTSVFTLNTAITPLTPGNLGGNVATFGYGTGVQLTGATLANPWGMGIDPSGNIYVVNYNSGDYNASSISKYNAAGVYQGTYGTSANLQQPSGIAFDSNGNGYVLNYNRTNNGQGNYHGNGYIDQYNSSGTYQQTIVQGLGTATGLAIDASNNLYVSLGSYNSGANTASQYNISGALAFSIASGYTANPVAVGVDGSYNIYVLDNTNKTVTKYNSTGAYVSTVISGLSNPNALYVDGAGDVYVGDSGTGKVVIYNSAFGTISTISGFTDPRGLVTDSNGNLYVSDYAANTVTKFAPIGGYFISSLLPPGLSFDSATGKISGTPTASFSATTYTITAYNAYGSSSTTVTLSCPPNYSAPIISYNPSINVFTTGAAVSLSASNAGGTPTSWSISPSLPANTLTFSNGTFSGTPTATGSATVYTVTATNASGSSTTKVSIAFVKDNYWTGSKNSDWNTKQNWSANTVPGGTSGYDLASIGVINYSGPDPIIASTTAATIKYITFGAANAATLTVQSGGSLTVNTIMTVNTNANPTLKGSGTGAIYIASTAVLNVNGTGALTINTSASTGNFVTLQSSATSSASVAAMTSGVISGNVTVERYLPAGTRGYRLLSSPVNTGTTDSYGNTLYSINYVANSSYVSGTNFPTNYNSGGFSKQGNPSMYLYRENLVPTAYSFLTSSFRGIKDMTASPYYTIDLDGSGFDIPVGNGYLYFFRGGANTTSPYSSTSTPAAATLSTTGKLNQGAITFKHWYTPGTSGLMYTTTNPDSTYRGFTLVGNPYACTIDLTTYATGGISMTNLSKFVYELDPVSKNYGVYTLDGSAPATTNASRYIASGQGFFVKASSTSPTPQLTFNESCKVENIQNSGTSLLLSKAPIVNMVPRYLRLRIAMDSINKEETVISFNNNAKASYALDEDAIYRQGTGKVNIASLSSDNKTIAVNTMPLETKGVSVRINVNATANGTYSLSMNSIQGIPELYDIWLMDAYKKDSVDMRHNKTYLFDVIKTDTASYGAYRFKLIMRQNPALAYHLLNFTASKSTGKQVQLAWVTEHEANYTNFTVERSTDGGTTYTIVGGVPSTSAGTYSLLDKTPGENNLYRLKQEDINNNITYSHIIPVGFANQSNNLAGNNINIYPNPASSTVNMSINTALSNSATTYNFTITNNYGLVIKQGTSAQANWQTNVNDLLPGTYVIQVVNNKDKSFVGKSKLVKL